MIGDVLVPRRKRHTSRSVASPASINLVFLTYLQHYSFR